MPTSFFTKLFRCCLDIPCPELGRDFSQGPAQGGHCEKSSLQHTRKCRVMNACLVNNSQKEIGESVWANWRNSSKFSGGTAAPLHPKQPDSHLPDLWKDLCERWTELGGGSGPSCQTHQSILGTSGCRMPIQGA